MVGRLSLQDVPELVDTKKKGDGVLDSPDSGLPPSPSPSHWGLGAAGGGGSGGERAPAPGTLESDAAATPAAPVSGPAPAPSLPIPPAAGSRGTTGQPRRPARGALSAPPPARRDGVAIAGSPGRERGESLASWSRWLENCHRLGGAGAPGEARRRLLSLGWRPPELRVYDWATFLPGSAGEGPGTPRRNPSLLCTVGLARTLTPPPPGLCPYGGASRGPGSSCLVLGRSVCFSSLIQRAGGGAAFGDHVRGVVEGLWKKLPHELLASCVPHPPPRCPVT